MEGGGGGDEAVVVAADKVLLLMLLMLMLMQKRLVLKLMEGRGRRGESLQAGADGMLLECLVLLLRPQQVRRYLVVLHQGERRGRRGRRLLMLLQGGRPRRWSRPRGHYADHLRLVVPANARARWNSGTVAGKVDRRGGHCGRPPLRAAAAGSSQLLDPLDPQEESLLVPQLEYSDVLQVLHRYAAHRLLQGSVSLLVEERPVLGQPQQVQPLLQGSLPRKSYNET